jgi:hypothetical protein
LGVLALGVRSYWLSDSITCLRFPRDSPTPRDWTVHSALGHVELYIEPHFVIDPAQRSECSYESKPADYHLIAPYRRTLVERLGFRYEVLQAGFTVNPIIMSVPHWFMFVLFLVCPGLWTAAGLRRRSRASRGLCAGCSYDLRGSAERCPECGRPIPPPS